jgi:hypothetical protein
MLLMVKIDTGEGIPSNGATTRPRIVHAPPGLAECVYVRATEEPYQCFETDKLR